MKISIITSLLIMLMSIFGVKTYAHDIAVKNVDGVTIYYYYINDGTELGVTCMDGNRGSYGSSVVIPEEVTYMNRTRKVTSIGSSAFNGCYNLTSISIPNSVTSIGGSAFWDCYALTSISIPNSVTSIGNYAFCGCSGLTSITIPNSVTRIEEKTFYNCSALTSVTIPISVKSIGECAFYGCI